jgi:hypothetical protein
MWWAVTSSVFINKIDKSCAEYVLAVLIKDIHREFKTIFKVKENCVWKKYSLGDCATQFRMLVDECDTKVENLKHGDVLDGNCVRWRLEMHVEGLDTIKRGGRFPATC